MPDAPADALSEHDALSYYEENAAKEVERWAEGDTSLLSKALRVASRPFEWAAERPEAEDVMKKVNEAIASFLDTLSDASAWTYDEDRVLERARDEEGIADADTLADLRPAPMSDLDDLAKTYFTENAVLSAIEGGGTGLGGIALLAADVPMLFTINLRVIQQIAASYGFRFDGPEARPLVLRIFSAAAADTPEARQDALEEMRAAGVAFAEGNDPSAPTSAGDVGLTEGGGVADSDGNASDGTATKENQSRVMINELARNVAARQMAQLVPLAGAATGAGMNYWFTHETAKTAYMLCRALFLERKHQ